jgi:hypothetical protein
MDEKQFQKIIKLLKETLKTLRAIQILLGITMAIVIGIRFFK